MTKRFIIKNIEFFSFFIMIFSWSEKSLSQGLPGGGQQSSDNIYFNSKIFANDESHYTYGINVPILKTDSDSHKLSVNNKFSNLENDEIESKFGTDHFHTTGLSWTYKKNRKDKDDFPWVGTLGYRINGNKFLENGRNNLSFKLMTGHKSKESMHNYGVALSSNGAFSGIPFPFYVYTTKAWGQNLTIGFPFISLSGPRENRTNYFFALSPGGISLKGIQKISEQVTLEALWSYSVDNYITESIVLSKKESLLIEKQTLGIEGKYRFHKNIEASLSMGKEFQKRYFVGENIFKKENVKFDMNSSNYIKLGIGFSL